MNHPSSSAIRMAIAALAASVSLPTIGREGLFYESGNVSADNIVIFPSRRYLAQLRYAAQHAGRHSRRK